MKKIFFALVAFILLTGFQGGGDVSVWQPGSGHGPTPTPIAEQPTELPLFGFPWTGAGVYDAGYCPVVYGHGWNGTLTWPVASHEGLRPFGYLPGTTHFGLDISAPLGTSVVAPTSGRVIWAGHTSSGFGNMVAIASSGRIVILAHLSEVFVWCGQSVVRGNEVGLVDRSGAATWPHVHLEVRFNGLSHDPMGFLR